MELEKPSLRPGIRLTHARVEFSRLRGCGISSVLSSTTRFQARREQEFVSFLDLQQALGASPAPV